MGPPSSLRFAILDPPGAGGLAGFPGLVLSPQKLGSARASVCDVKGLEELGVDGVPAHACLCVYRAHSCGHACACARMFSLTLTRHPRAHSWWERGCPRTDAPTVSLAGRHGLQKLHPAARRLPGR